MSRSADSSGATPGERGSARLRRLLAAAASLLPSAIVLGFAAWLLWPIWAMPLSADHTVHLTRIALTAERLARTASLSGWEPTWFFGFPLGELYPQLGDLLIIAIHALGLGRLDWPAAYALGFAVVFALQGLVLVRIGRLFGLGRWPGLIAALLLLADPGFTREGGWMYTVYFGVWPQALATTLAWLGLGELARALGWPLSTTTRAGAPWPGPRDPDHDGARATILAGICFGAALLAHPIALPTLAIGGLVFVITMVPRGVLDLRRSLARCLLAGLIGASLAAWWWLPMLQHRAWMASYGWLFAPFEHMLRWLVEDGRWAQRMPAAVGFAALLGLGLSALGVGRFARFVALFVLFQWLLASSDTFWQLRLDRFGEGFTHIQYQRFLIGAKPGLFLLAGLAVSAPWVWGLRLGAAQIVEQLAELRGGGERFTARRVVLAAVALTLIAASLWGVGRLARDTRAAMSEFEVGEVQHERVVGEPEFEAHYHEFLAWAASQWQTREHDYRLAIRTPRNSHLFMDAPVWTGTPQYKQGFTPGDNFVHKPESRRREVLDALGVRWVVSHHRGRALPGEVARFGTIVVREHRGDPWPLVQVVGDEGVELEGARVEVLQADLRAGLVRARVHLDEHLRAAPPDLRVVFAIAGYPRWQLRVDGEPLEWFEVPVWGEGEPASLARRRAGELRGGKADGDDGSEPTLIAAQLPAEALAGRDRVELELRYRARNELEWLAEIVSLIACLLLALALARRGPWPRRVRRVVLRWERALARALHPIVVIALVLAVTLVAGLRWRQAAERERLELLGWVEAGAVDSEGVEPGPVKTEMLIRPAVLMRPRPGHPAWIELELDALPEELHGWIGIDDDQAQQRGRRFARHQVRIEVQPRDGAHMDADEDWSTLVRVSVPHQPRRVPIAASTGALAGRPARLRIIDETRGKRLPRLGLMLELGEQP